MGLPWEEIVASRSFEFLVGPNEKLFGMHSALVAHLSQPLHALVHGKMLESNQGRARLVDVDEQTFVRFIEFAYTGEYTPADPEILLQADDIGAGPEQTPDEQSSQPCEVVAHDEELLEVAEPTNDAVTWTASTSRRGRKMRSQFDWHTAEPPTPPEPPKAEAWSKFKKRSYHAPQPSVFEPRQNVERCEGYRPVFLGHARLYVFAEKWDIDNLRQLSLHKLQQTLACFELYRERLVDVTELLTYAYSNDNTRDRQDDTIDELRSLLAHYAACVVKDLNADASFQDFMENNGAFGRDLIQELTKRLA